MTWASVLITLFIYFPLFLIALRQPYRSPQLSTDFTPPSQILPPYFHPYACPLPFLSSLSPPPPPPSSFPAPSPRYCIQDSGFGCLQQPD